MKARDLRSHDVVVVIGAEVESVFTEAGSTFVTYRDSPRTGEVFASDDDLVVAREED